MTKIFKPAAAAPAGPLTDRRLGGHRRVLATAVRVRPLPAWTGGDFGVRLPLCIVCICRVVCPVPEVPPAGALLRPVKAMLDRNFRCTVTEYVLVPCSMRKPRSKSVYESRARVHTEQDDLW